MLIVMKDRNIAFFLQPALDFKTARRGDILQINPAEAAGDQFYRTHQLVGILAFDAQRNRVYVGKSFKQRTLSLHDRHSCFGADIAQPQHCRAIGDDCD